MKTTNPSKPIASKLPIIKITIDNGFMSTLIVFVDGATRYAM